MRKGLVYTHGFLVEDVDKETAFYTENLGYKIQRTGESFVVFETDSPTGLFLWGYDHLTRHLGREAMSKVKHRAMTCVLYNTSSEVDEEFNRIVEQGASVIAAPQKWPWNAYAAYVTDPFGFLWELWAWL